MKVLNQTVQWHITEVCPNRCRHCYIGNSSNEERHRNELDLQGMICILDNLEEFEKKYDASINSFVITGGDPFEHPEFKEFLNELYLRGKRIMILGIPERITEDNLRLLEQYQVGAYQVSLDGMKATHDMIRGKGSFDRTISALKMINHFSNIHPCVMFTLHKQNSEEMFEVIEYLEKEEIRATFSFDFMILEGAAKDNCSLLDKMEVDEILDKYRKKKMQLKAMKSKLFLSEKVKLFETFDVENANEKFEKYSYVSGCYCGISSVAILPNGDCMPCRRLPFKIGNLLEESYSDLFFNNSLMRKLRRISSYIMCGDCDYAKVCRGCAALAYSATGDVFGPMVYCNKKKRVEPKLNEPPLDCTELEEFNYVTNNILAALEKEGGTKNIEAVKYRLYKNFINAYEF